MIEPKGRGSQACLYFQHGINVITIDQPFPPLSLQDCCFEMIALPALTILHEGKL